MDQEQRHTEVSEPEHDRFWKPEIALQYFELLDRQPFDLQVAQADLRADLADRIKTSAEYKDSYQHYRWYHVLASSTPLEGQMLIETDFPGELSVESFFRAEIMRFESESSTGNTSTPTPQ